MRFEQFAHTLVLVLKSAKVNISEIRKEYTSRTLNETDTGDEPVQFFQQWLNEAIENNVKEPTAMVISTVSAESRPSSRVVLLKGIENRGFVFFTNYLSRKGQDLATNHAAALLFFWPELERQVRIEGIVSKVSPADSDLYFQSRPIESRVGAIVSRQSSVIPDRATIEHEFNNKLLQLQHSVVERPSHWGGYFLMPDRIEFWQGRPGRLHDRLQFLLKSGNWSQERLSP